MDTCGYHPLFTVKLYWGLGGGWTFTFALRTDAFNHMMSLVGKFTPY